MRPEKAVENKPQAEVAPVQTHHVLHVNGQTLNYTATAGMMPLKNDKGETEANIFFMAYTLDPPEGKRDSKRPLMFAFNGGPGSASVWLHLGAIGPRTVHMQQPDGAMPAPPYQVEDNENTWLTQTDLVFIDPVGTGLQPRHQAGAAEELSWSERRHSGRWQVHPALSGSLRALELAALPGGRELWNHACLGALRVHAAEVRGRVQRHRADVDGIEL